MKSKRFQIFAILLAFCFGVTINYSCGDNYLEVDDVTDNQSPSSSPSSSSNSDCGFYVDGIWFNASGRAEGKIKTVTLKSYGVDGSNSSSTDKYEYDSYGRIIKIVGDSYTTTYQYNGKTITQTITSGGRTISIYTTTLY